MLLYTVRNLLNILEHTNSRLKIAFIGNALSDIFNLNLLKTFNKN